MLITVYLLHTVGIDPVPKKDHENMILNRACVANVSLAVDQHTAEVSPVQILALPFPV